LGQPKDIRGAAQMALFGHDGKILDVAQLLFHNRIS
jgi:hypothetical protein